MGEGSGYLAQILASFVLLANNLPALHVGVSVFYLVTLTALRKF
jgi:hypothetical protein